MVQHAAEGQEQAGPVSCGLLLMSTLVECRNGMRGMQALLGCTIRLL